MFGKFYKYIKFTTAAEKHFFSLSIFHNVRKQMNKERLENDYFFMQNHSLSNLLS